jgi:lysophospholipase L1-like esterase
MPSNSNPAATPSERINECWWIERHKEKLAEAQQRPVDLIFIGDSIIQNWEKNGPLPWGDFRPIWTKYYGGRNALNLGFAGDTTANVLWRLDHGELEGIAPKVAVLLIGANNSEAMDWTAADTEKGIDAVIKNVRCHLSQTKILLLGILPSDRSAKITQTNLAVNKYLSKKYRHTKLVTYLDLSPVFSSHGKVIRNLYFESLKTPPSRPLHPNVTGQEKMAEAIEKPLAKLMGERRMMY